MESKTALADAVQAGLASDNEAVKTAATTIASAATAAEALGNLVKDKHLHQRQKSKIPTMPR